jgi:hypothetical protein
LGVQVSGRRHARASAARPAGLALLVGPQGEENAEQAIVDGLAPFRQPDGSYRLESEYRYLIARG